MRNVTMNIFNILHFFIAQALAKHLVANHASNLQNFRDNLANKLVERVQDSNEILINNLFDPALQVWALHRADNIMDHATLGKPARLATSPRTVLRGAPSFHPLPTSAGSLSPWAGIPLQIRGEDRPVPGLRGHVYSTGPSLHTGWLRANPPGLAQMSQSELTERATVHSRDWAKVDSTEWPATETLLEAQQCAKAAAAAMDRAVVVEDYMAAARHKKEVEAFRKMDPMWELRSQLRSAVAKQEFGRAAECHRALKRLRVDRPKLLWRDSLLVLRARREVWVYPDGGNGQLLYSAPRGLELALPTWSPDGELIGMSESPGSGTTGRVFVLSVEDGTEIASVKSPPVVHLSFTPDGQALTFLQIAPVAVAPKMISMLNVLNLNTKKAERVRNGAQLYYALGPNGALLEHDAYHGKVTHALGANVEGEYRTGAGEVNMLRDPNSPTSSDSRSSAFRAPVLDQQGRYAAFVEGQQIVGVDMSSGDRQVLFDLPPGTVGCLLMLSADGCRLAVLRSIKTAEMPTPGLELTLLSAPSPADLFRGHVKAYRLPSSIGSTVSVFFSPDSTKLLSLDVNGAPVKGKEGPGGNLAAWTVWQLAPVTEDHAPTRKTFDVFEPSMGLVQVFVPFFDQFGKTATPWSPDSTSFCYTKRDGSVHIQRLASESCVDGWRWEDVEEGEGHYGQPVSPEAHEANVPADIALWSPC